MGYGLSGWDDAGGPAMVPEEVSAGNLVRGVFCFRRRCLLERQYRERMCGWDNAMYVGYSTAMISVSTAS